MKEDFIEKKIILKSKLKIIPEKKYNFYLKSITEDNLECLREWKNNNRKSFFFQEIISWEQQNAWFAQYCRRKDDYIFMIMDYEQNAVGCLGFRIKEGEADIYNVIRGIENAKSIKIHDAMYVMITYILEKYNTLVRCDVLKDNPAVEWYKKCGFDILEEKAYYVMGFDASKIPQITIFVEEEQ